MGLKKKGKNCWDFFSCRWVPGNSRRMKKICPAYPKYGRECWFVAGTFCDGLVSSRRARKIGDCKKCRFYQLVINGQI